MSIVITLVAGTRPNFVKASPLWHALRDHPAFEPRLLAVQQQESPALNVETRADLGLDGAEVQLVSVAGDVLGARLGSIVDGLTFALTRDRPDLVVVFGDVDTTLAGAIAAKRLCLPLAHVEAGLRSHDRSMPEELNRRMVDAISDLLFTTSDDAFATLVEQEGQPVTAVHAVGNLMIDTLLRTVDRDHGTALCQQLEVAPGSFALATFHRPSNVDDPSSLEDLLKMLKAVATRLPILLPLHPRTAASLARHGLDDRMRNIPGLLAMPALRYRDFVSLMSRSRLVLTDSGGLQEESSILGLPCLTVRGNTERPITVDLGSNHLVDPADAPRAVDAVLTSSPPTPAKIPGWDGKAASRIVDVLLRWAESSR